jgi:pimeloyl-ACP methyl ester carboxylesterase
LDVAHDASPIAIRPKFDNFGYRWREKQRIEKKVRGLQVRSDYLCYDRDIMYRSPSRLWLLPDLGMDSRLFQPQAGYFSNFESPTLPRFSAEEALAPFAARSVDFWLADSEVAKHTQGRFFLGGVGFGGMLAMEMGLAFAARSIRPAGIFLIGSARFHTYIANRSRLRLTLLSRFSPMLGRWRLSNRFRKLATDESMNESQRRILQDMARDVDWELFRWQVHAMLNWQRSRSDFEASRIPIHQLHGRGDRVFRVPTVEDATILIHGKHLVNLSLSGEVNRWIESVLRDDDLRQAHPRESSAR